MVVQSVDKKLIAEYGTIKRLLNLYPTGFISIVSDSYDFFGVLTEVLPRLKTEIFARDGRTVLRPDSGDPSDIICGTARHESELFDKVANTRNNSLNWGDGLVAYDDYGNYYRVEWVHDSYNGNSIKKTKLDPSEVTPEMKGAVQCLWDTFGGTTNELGYRTLDSHVGLIYGDSINAKRMDDILSRLQLKKFAANNVVYGIGSYSYNMSSRDTWGMAMKATWAVVDGIARNLQKDPKTGDGTKKSATGLINVYLENGKFVAYDKQDEIDTSDKNQLAVAYRNGVLYCNTTLSEIRKRLWNW